MIDPLRAVRAVLIAVSISVILVYAAAVELIRGQDGASVSFATAIYAGDESADLSIEDLPGVQQLAGMLLIRSLDVQEDGGCLHMMHANAALEVDSPPGKRQQLLSLMWAYISLGADPNFGCGSLGAPPLWDAVLDLDRIRISLLLAAGADPDRTIVRTNRHPLGLNLHELIELMRIRHAAHGEVLETLDEIEAQLWSNGDARSSPDDE